MSDVIVLLVVVLLPAAFVLAPLAVFALGVAAVADFDETGLVGPATPPVALSRPPGP